MIFSSLFKKKMDIVNALSFIGTDMHSHLLPGLDDGLQTIEESVAFIKELQTLGYKKLICTPHVITDVHLNSGETILPKLDLVRKALKEENINVEIQAAAEYMVDYEFERKLKNKEPFLTMGDNYILIEMSYAMPHQNIENVIFDLNIAGYKPILAHPERYGYFHSNYDYYATLRSRGCYFQLNMLSICGYYGKMEKKVSHRLLKDNCVEFVGTDMHHLNHLNVTKLFGGSGDAYKALKGVELWNKYL
jgi:protein-tyrosine phosphatase